MAKFFYIPFGANGDIETPVPDEPQPDGSVSYSAGFGSNFQLPLASGGAALPINRVQFNSMMNDVTGAIQNMQTQGVFSWIGPVADAPLSGANYPYPINALAYYTDGNIYQSLIANNQDIPGATANWLNISRSSSGVPIGSVIDYAGVVIPANYLLCDGTAYSRTTYASLFAAIANSQTGNTHTTTTVDGIASTAMLKAGFFVSGPGVQAGTTIASVTNSTTIVLSVTTTTTVTGNPLVFSPWGIGDGSTTFNVPTITRSVTVGTGGTAANGLGNVIGQVGGAETSSAVPAHTHPFAIPAAPGDASEPPFTDVLGTNVFNSNITGLNTAENSGAENIILWNPAVVLYKAIKFQ